MFKKEYVAYYIRYGLLAAILYGIPMIIFISSKKFGSAWWLYVGNALFFISIAAFILAFNKMKGSDTSTQTMIAAGHCTVAVGILTAVIIAAISLAIFDPTMFSSTPTNTDILENAPSQTGTGETHGLIFILFMSAIIGNMITGSFASIIVPYTSKKDQTKDRKSEVLNN